MTFDRTQGKPARYLVSIYGWNVEDKYYYHYYKEARKQFERIKATGIQEGHSVSLYDMNANERKSFFLGKEQSHEETL